jgi:hypothetical protein
MRRRSLRSKSGGQSQNHGANQDGANQDGANQDGANQDGANEDGANEDGANANNANQDDTNFYDSFQNDDNAYNANDQDGAFHDDENQNETNQNEIDGTNHSASDLFQHGNREIEQPQITDSKEIRNKLLKQTAASYQKTLTESKISEALPHMYKQKGVIDLKIPEILILGFTEEEENELLQRYIDQPFQKSGDQALQIMDEIVTLDKDITSNIARNFQHWSDRFSSQAVPLSKLTTKTSRFILDTEIMRQRNKLQMSMEEATHWYTTLNHTQLAEIVTRLWNDDTDNSKRMTLDDLTESKLSENFKTTITDTWRFCLDYRKSNDYTKSASWPMPNMQQ